MSLSPITLVGDRESEILSWVPPLLTHLEGGWVGGGMIRTFIRE